MIDNIALASIYRLTAVNFWESAKQLDATMEKHENGSPAKLTAIPFYFLISHAVELFLKSALLKRGFTENDLKKYDYRHNLNLLLEALQKKGVSVTPETVNMINALHLQHKNHELRYTVLLDDGKTTYWPPTSLVHPMLEELLLLTRLSTQGR
ncbi:MAG: hypothetical protein AUH25_04875 [Thaumarchaeota archaeon 13_1_40CM_38_12]|nr:MAG: hypothetical protein AUH25_04875 [Thaumarchaeota archaeon 13_1_40CM_38_12]OLC33510.1 MAG: hypothetical protein AUH84_06915 [Thaumarchaeota archaeon 13_1_40CM_4_38_7]